MKVYSLDSFVNNKHTRAIKSIVFHTGVKLEGNCLYRHNSDFKIRDHKEVDNLRYNIHALAKRSKRILEVGFNAGHSALLSFLANPTVYFLAFDIASHAYTVPCAKYLSNYYNLELVTGNSKKTIPEYKAPRSKFDLIHVDGGHSQTMASNDIMNCKKFAKKNTLLLVDDANQKGVKTVIEQYIKDGILEEVPLKQLKLKETKYHKLFRYLD